MIENRHTVPANVEQSHTAGPAAPWVGGDLNAAPVDVRGKRILLVEDEEPLRACLRMMLEMEGHHVAEARNGAAALYVFKMSVFDVIITDFEMPVMQGNKLAVEIKRLVPHLPILMISASEKARRSIDNPVDAVLTKPFTVADLHAALGKLLAVPPDPPVPANVRTPETPTVTFDAEPELIARVQG